jgi:hypothetical protein
MPRGARHWGSSVSDCGPVSEKRAPEPVANLLYAAIKRHNLLLPMITGWKTLPASVPHPRMAGQARAIFFFGCSALAAAAMVNFV